MLQQRLLNGGQDRLVSKPYLSRSASSRRTYFPYYRTMFVQV